MSSRRLSCRCILRTLAALAFVSFLSIPEPATAQRQEFTLFVSALDRTGNPVESLSPDDVVVREDGVAREVLRIGKVVEPMHLAILVDNSTAARSAMPDFRDGLSAFVRALEPMHRISLVTYADRPTLVVNLSTDRERLEQAIRRLFVQPGSGSYLLEAIEETTRGFLRQESPRPVIVVVATQGVEFSSHGSKRVLDPLTESGAQLHILQLTNADQPVRMTPEDRERELVVDRGTRATGGRRQDLVASMGFPEALRSLAAELDGQFRVVYTRPESLIGPNETTVSSARPDLEVRGVLSKAKD